MRPGDIVIIALAVGLVAALGWRQQEATPQRLHVTSAALGSQEFPAWQARRLHVPGPLGTTQIEISDGRARVVASPCSNKLCLRAGWLERAGDATACVPNRVSVVLLGGDPRFDAMNF